jgi:hypothetical protein
VDRVTWLERCAHQPKNPSKNVQNFKKYKPPWFVFFKVLNIF